MLELGEWRWPKVPGTSAGFHLSSLYSPMGKWREIAASWEKAAMSESRSVATIKAFKNSELGEAWVEEAKPRLAAPAGTPRGLPHRLCACRRPAAHGGADVQKDRIEVSVWAFGRGKESWLVEHRVLMGDTARDEVWRRSAQCWRDLDA